MTQLRTPLEVYKILPGTNCGRCFLPSCLAFSAAVIRGDRKLTDCPPLRKSGTVAQVTAIHGEQREKELQEQIGLLQARISQLDLGEAAARIGGELCHGRLRLQVLGKIYDVDPVGHVTSVCHTHPGLVIPLLNYILDGRDVRPCGRWVAFRDLKDGPSMNPLFVQRGEIPLRQLADSQPEFFADLVSVFSGHRAEADLSDTAGADADISVVLYPLPRLPVMICYWQPEDDLESKLHILFDACADDQLGIRAIYSLTVGLVMMFEKIARGHT
ncbi:MAG: DUF3786 domain-containing protein [Desulfobulbaceae bacterium]|uniref:DUF3786 domain-containing protein n=1 Tax=Candidatus Desulfatifera sulfidica TaxID=2841691 RepID=A0A8J6NC83_9BACT|nr:DUF3786 domain-containing protein [Candidatus Desulfatifera sulfidica]